MAVKKSSVHVLQPRGKQNFSLFLPVELHDRIKEIAAREGKSMTKIIIEALRKHYEAA